MTKNNLGLPNSLCNGSDYKKIGDRKKNIEMLQSMFFSCETFLLTGDLRPKLQTCFYYTFLLMLWRKSLVQSFLGWSVSQCYEATKFWIWRKWRHTRGFRDHKPGFLLWNTLIINSCRRNLLQKFIMFLVFFHKLTKLTKLRWIKLCLGVNDVMMRIILHDISIAHHKKKKKSIVLACKFFD